MRDRVVEELAEACTGEVAGDVRLDDFTTLKVGGPARVLVTAETDADLAAVGRAATEHRLPWLIVGRGSNMLVSDSGWRGIAVNLGRGFRGFDVDGSTVTMGAAEKLPVIAVRIANEGLTGFEWAAAVPGSVGGAVRMNAGAHGGEMRDALVEVDLVRLRTGVRESWPVALLGLTYRHSDLPDDAVIVSATIALEPAQPPAIRAAIDEIKRWRREHQPINEPNCGSVFANPSGDSAGRLVDSIGGKGIRVGGAHVSQMHANFIVTEPGATASDVRALIRRLRQAVADAHGVWLRPEVQMVGDFDDGGLGGP